MRERRQSSSTPERGRGACGTTGCPSPSRRKGCCASSQPHGVERDEIDIVLLSHVHIDHVGWNAQDDGSATFPRARYLLHEDALAAARRRSERAHIGRCVLGVEDRLETVTDGQEIVSGVSVVELPGHDDGHIGLLVGDHAVIVADAVPHPAQLEHPEWTFGYDEDHQRAIETRRRIRDDFGDRLIYMSHLAGGWHR